MAETKDRRQDALRVIVSREVESSSSGISCPARMVNLSTSGCALRFPVPSFGKHDAVRIDIPGVTSVAGKVVWAKDDRVGIAFAEPLHGAVVMYFGFEDEAGVTLEDLRNDQLDGAMPSPGSAERRFG